VNVSARKLLVSVGLLAVVCGVATSQPVPPVPPVPSPSPRLEFPPPGPPPANIPPVIVPTAPTYPVPPAPPPEKTVDELLNDLERVQTQKAELDKREQELKATIRKKLEKQTERLNKLGVTPKKEEKEPDRVGRIIIEGNTKTPDQKILEKVDLLPGQILHYPALEASRARLEKAGFTGVVVEVIANEMDSKFKDIRVRVTEVKQP
jgi:hypothetical protein